MCKQHDPLVSSYASSMFLKIRNEKPGLYCVRVLKHFSHWYTFKKGLRRMSCATIFGVPSMVYGLYSVTLFPVIPAQLK